MNLATCFGIHARSTRTLDTLRHDSLQRAVGLLRTDSVLSTKGIFMIDGHPAVRSHSSQRVTASFTAAARAPHRRNSHPREAAIPVALLMAQAGEFWSRAERKDKRAVERFARLAQLWADAHGRVTPSLQSSLTAIEHRYAAVFTAGARCAWQSLLARLGARTSLPIRTPAESIPYWLKDGHPLVGWGSLAPLPEAADVVIIGAGLTGVAAAYALAIDPRAAGLRTVLLESGDVGTQASGRNGGNFQILPENCFGTYAGLVCERAKLLRTLHPQTAPRLLQAQAEQQARIVLEIALRNRAILLENMQRADIAADLSRAGRVSCRVVGRRRARSRRGCPASTSPGRPHGNTDAGATRYPHGIAARHKSIPRPLLRA